MEAYPFDLRTILSASKSRKQAASFTVTDPRRGRPYAQAIGTDTPVVWSVGFLFSRADSIRFQLWFKHKINNGLDEFTMPIKTEFGIVEHVCQFLPDGLLDTGEAGTLFSYSGTIMARERVIPDGYDDAADIIVSLPNWEEYASWLDVAIVEGMPT